jgi:hypothetical protein
MRLRPDPAGYAPMHVHRPRGGDGLFGASANQSRNVDRKSWPLMSPRPIRSDTAVRLMSNSGVTRLRPAKNHSPLRGKLPRSATTAEDRVLLPRLHSCNWNRPQFCHHVDFRPRRDSHVARPVELGQCERRLINQVDQSKRSQHNLKRSLKSTVTGEAKHNGSRPC